MSPRSLAILILLSATAPAACALTPVPGGTRPFPTCRLDVDNRTGRVVQAVCLQDVRGGLRVLKPVTIAPGAKQAVLIPTPATSTDQVYRVDLLASPAPDAAVLDRSEQRVSWPAATVEAALATMVDSQAYDKAAAHTPAWPHPFRQNLLLLAGIAGLAAVGTLFLRRGRLRLAALGVVVAAATAGATVLLDRQQLLFVREEGTLIQVAARRTCAWTDSRKGITPIYAVAPEIARDNRTLLIADQELRTVVSPDVVRLFDRGH